MNEITRHPGRTPDDVEPFVAALVRDVAAETHLMGTSVHAFTATSTRTDVVVAANPAREPTYS